MEYLGHTFTNHPTKAKRWYICSKCTVEYYKGETIDAFYSPYAFHLLNNRIGLIDDISCDEYIIKSILE